MMDEQRSACREAVEERQGAISTTIAVQRNLDPAVGMALINQLVTSIDGRELLTAEHRHLVAALRRHLDARASAARAMVEEIVPRKAGSVRRLAESMEGAAERVASVEDAIVHAMVVAGMLGDLERVIILRILSVVRGAVIRLDAQMTEVLMSAEWVDIGGSG
jgi:hypothetical protein